MFAITPKQNLSKILSPEIWQDIGAYWSTEDLKNFKQVSRQSLASSRDLGLKLTLNRQISELLQRTSENDHLREFLSKQYFSQIKLEPPKNALLTEQDITRKLFSSNLRVHTLEIPYLLTSSEFKNYLAQGKNLQRLILHIKDLDVYNYLAPLATELQQLKSLKITATNVINLGQALALFSNLTSLDLEDSALSDQDLEDIATHLTGLQSLNIAYVTNLTCFNALNKLVNLQVLSMRRLTLKNADLLKLSQNLTRLQVLDLTQCPYLDDFIPLGNFKELRELKLSYLPITNSVLTHIGLNCLEIRLLELNICERLNAFSFLENFPELTSLSIIANGYIDTDTLTLLSNACSKLRKLTLIYCRQLTFLTNLRRLQNLRELYMCPSFVNELEVALFKRMRPDVKMDD